MIEKYKNIAAFNTYMYKFNNCKLLYLCVK